MLLGNYGWYAYLKGIFAEIRWFAIKHFQGHDTKGPNVDFGSILFANDHLWCHPVRRAHHSGAFGLIWTELGAKTEVGQLYRAVQTQEDVV